MALFFSQVGDNSFDLPEANVLIQVRQVKKMYFTHTKIYTNHSFGGNASVLQVLLLDFLFYARLINLRAYFLTLFKISSHGGSRRQVSVLYHLCCSIFLSDSLREFGFCH